MVTGATGFTPAELMSGGKGPNIFEDFLPEAPEGGGTCVRRRTEKNRQSLQDDDKENRHQKEKQKEGQGTLET